MVVETALPPQPEHGNAIVNEQRRSVASLHCLFNYDDRLGGAIHAALNVCRYLAESGQTVESVASFLEGDDVGYLEKQYAGFPRHRVARSWPQRFCNASALDPWLEQNLNRFDVVDLHGIFVLTTVRAARVCQRFEKPYFVHSHGALDPFDLRKRARLKRFLGPLYIRPLLQRAAGVICTSQIEADRLVTFGASPRRFVVPLPVPFATVSPEAGLGFRSRHGIPADALVVLCLSRIDRGKGFEFLIPALAEVKREQPNLWFVLAGTGASGYLTEIRQLLGQHGIEKWTTETGWLSGAKKHEVLSAANVFALPSEKENFAIALIEAMSAGLPILISDQVYIHREVLAFPTGVLCQTSSASCAQGLRQLLASPDELKRMGSQAKVLARTQFGPESATASLMGVYRSALPAATMVSE